MSKKTIKKITMTVGVGLLTATLNPTFLNHQLLTELSVEATTSKITYTDEQKITYNLDNVSMTAEVSSYSGLVGADIVIPDIIVSNGQTYAVTSIGTYAFSNSGIHSVVIGNNVIDINTSAFQTTTAFPDYYKKSLTEVVLGANVQNIKTDAFAGNALTSIIFPNSVTKIATRAFANNNLTKLSFGPNVTEIMPKAFQSNQISSITFDADSLTTVDSTAFSGSPVCSLILGNGVSLAEDVFNKVSPLFGQLTDLPATGIRTIIVDSNGLLEKSWINAESTNSTNNDSNKVDTDAPISDEITDQLNLSNQKLTDTADDNSSNDSITTLPNQDENLGPNSESDSNSLASDSNENLANGSDSDLSMNSASNEQNDSSLDSSTSTPTTSNTENSTISSTEGTGNPDNGSVLDISKDGENVLKQEPNNSSLASSTPVEATNSETDSNILANEDPIPAVSSPAIVDNASNSSGSDVSANTNLSPKIETPPTATAPAEKNNGSKTAAVTSNTESPTSTLPSSEVRNKSDSNSNSNLSTSQEVNSSAKITTIPSETSDSDTASIVSNAGNATSSSPSSEVTGNSNSNSNSNISTSQGRGFKPEDNVLSTSVETNNKKLSQTALTTETSTPLSELTSPSSSESLAGRKTSLSSEIKTSQSVPTFEPEESEGGPNTNTGAASAIDKITENRKDVEEKITLLNQSKVDFNKSTITNSSKELDETQLVDEKLLKGSSEKLADSGKQLPFAPANSQGENDKVVNSQNILQILPNSPESNTLNRVELEHSDSNLTDQNPAQNLKEISPILRNSPIASPKIDQGMIQKFLKSNKESQKSQSQLLKNLPLILNPAKISAVKLIAKDNQEQNENASLKINSGFSNIALEKSEMTLRTPDSSTHNLDSSSNSDSDSLNQEGQSNLENRDKLFSEKEEAGAIINDNPKLSNPNELSKNNSKINYFVSLLIIIIGSALGWFIIFFKKKKR